MKNLGRELTRACFTALSSAGVVAASLVAIDTVMPRPSNASVNDTLNIADMNFRVGNEDMGCLMISTAITEAPQANASQRAEIARYAKRCNLRF